MEKRKRLLAHSDAFLVVEWLNAARRNGAYRRVDNVRKELESLERSLADLRQDLIEAIKSKAPRKMREVNKLRERYRERHNRLNQMLSRYSFVPALAYSVETGAWRFNTVPRRTHGQVVRINDQIGVIRISEASVIAALARLAVSGDLDKVRLCANCGKRWVFSLREIDKFCGKECRVYFHVHSEEGKRRHREAQAKYRKRDGGVYTE